MRGRRLVVLFGLALACIALVGCGGDDGDGGGAGGEDGWAGTFESSFGNLTFEQQGNKVTGSYDFCGGRLIGTADGRRLTGDWEEDPAACEAGEVRSPTAETKGSFDFTLSSDGSSFSGTWRYASGEKDPGGDTWEGTRISD
jgi:hypothetical protein